MSKYAIYGLGAALVDTEVEVTDDDLASLGVDKGMMTLVDVERQNELYNALDGHMHGASHASGGSACNTVVGASYFGAKTWYSCKVADDDNGAFYLKDIKNAGVDTDITGVSGEGETGRCLVLITPDAERSMNTYLGISASLGVEQLNLDAIADSEYFYMEGYLVTSDTGRAAAVKARQTAEAAGVKTALSFSDPGMVEFFADGIAEMLGDGVDLVFCNEAEARGWAKTDDIDVAIEAIKKVAKTFAITLGAKGALVFDGEQLHTIAPFAVKALDSNGAGDMFAGAFLYGLSAGMDFPTAGKLASRASAEVVSRYGPRLPAQVHGELLAEIIG